MRAAETAARDPIRWGMVGGGRGAFIGGVHRLAAAMDGHYVLVAGALSSDRRRAIASARDVGVTGDRAYDDYAKMAAAETARDDGIDAVTIVTPNDLHAPVATAFLKAGIHVICDKPLSLNVREARELVRLTKRSGKIFALTHNYTGYPMVRQARAMVAAGELGDLRTVQVEYAQGWLTERVEATGHKQAAWRTDPKRSGGGAIADIGTHAHNLACFVTGLPVEALAADLTTSVKGRRVDDNANVLLRFSGGVRGSLWASQVAPGNENNLSLRVYGAKGGIHWRQEEPDLLRFTRHGEPPRLIVRGGAGAGPEAARLTRVPAGHPEGYLEGFGNIYSEIAHAIHAARDGRAPDPAVAFPTVEDGLDGMRFIEAAVKSTAKGGGWVKL